MNLTGITSSILSELQPITSVLEPVVKFAVEPFFGTPMRAAVTSGIVGIATGVAISAVFFAKADKFLSRVNDFQTVSSYKVRGEHKRIVESLRSLQILESIPLFLAKLVVWKTGFDINAPTAKWDYTPLQLALDEKLTGLARVFLNLGANVNVKTGQGTTPLSIASGHFNYNPEMIRLLVEHGGDVNTADRSLESSTLLVKAIEKRDLDTVRYLLDHRASVDALTPNQWSPLHEAANANLPAAAGLLLARGAMVDAPDASGRTPLYLAVYEGHRELVEMFMNHGADPYAISPEFNKSPLTLAEVKCPHLVPLLQRGGSTTNPSTSTFFS